MRRLSPVRGFVCRCAPRHTPSLKRARSRVGYVSMPARIHISAGRSGVEKHAGDSSLECVYIEMHRESLRDVFDTNLWARFLQKMGGKIFDSSMYIQCEKNINLSHILQQISVRGKRFCSKTNG